MSNYLIGRWLWSGGPEFWRWKAPHEGQLATLDMRSYDECAVQGGVGGYGLFEYPEAAQYPDLIPLASDPNELISAASRAAMEDAFKTRLSATRFADAVAELFLSSANIDVTGATKRRPLMPTTRRRLDLYLGGLIYSRETGVGDEAWPVVLAQYQYDFRQLRLAYGDDSDVVRRVLGDWMLRYGVRDATVFQTRGDPVIEPLAPASSYADTFNRSDSSNLNASSTGKTPDFTWTEASGDWSISSNRLIGPGAGGFTFYNLRASADLSSSNNYCQITAVTIGEQPGVAIPTAICRHHASAFEGYGMLWNAFDGEHELEKIVAGGFTQLAVGGTTRADGDVLKCEANGSSITGYRNGSANISTLTDTSITSGVRGGVSAIGSSANYQFDDFEMADLGGAASAVVFRRTLSQFGARTGSRQIQGA